MILDINKGRMKHGFTVLAMKGSIHTGPDCRRIEQEVESLIRGNDTRIILDLSNVTHIDSAAIGCIVRCVSHVKKCCGALRLAGASGMIEHSFQLTKLHKIIEIYPTATDAAEHAPQPVQGAENL